MTPSPPYRVVWIAGVPRTGSTWAFNVVRSLLRQSKAAVLPAAVPTTDEAMFDEAKAAWAETEPSGVRVLKVHAALRPDLPDSRFVVTHRDPRDVVVSYMRFMRCDFEAAFAALPGWLRLTDHYLGFPTERIVHLREPDIVAHPRREIARLARFLGLTTTDDTVARIAAEHRRSTVTRRIVGLARSTGGTREVYGADGSPRLFDAGTGFQTDHVSETDRDGGWRSSLSTEQIERIHALHGAWLTAHGYAID